MADGRGGTTLGLPEAQECFQPAENARQGGHDEGVDGGGNPGALLLCLHGAMQAGDLVAEGGVRCFHGVDNN